MESNSAHRNDNAALALSTNVSRQAPAAQPFAAESAAARTAQKAWEQTPIKERLRPVRVLRHLLADEKLEICRAIQADVGKPIRDALAGDVLPLAEVCRFLERRAAGILRPRRSPLRDRPVILWGQRDWVYRRPRGLIGIIGTWNLPIIISGMQIAPALVAGNGVLFKPSELAARSGALLADLLLRAGFPEGLVQLLPATREAGPQLAQADLDHVIFTGHSTTGRLLAQTLASRLVTSTLELSGCDPLILLEDGDVTLAAQAAWFGATINDGQACLGTRRAFVPRSKLPEFLDVLRPLVLREERRHAVLPAQIDAAERAIEDACARGATLLRRESPGDGPAGDALVQPAALVDVPADALLCRDGVFAPLLGVLPYDRLDDVLAKNRHCPYGLTASIFSADRDAAHALAARLECGVVCVNDVLAPIGHPAMPFGGRRGSGWGVTKGVEGLLEMTVPQVVSVVAGRSRPHFDWQGSHWFIQQDTVEAAIDLRHARSWRRSLAAGWRLLKRSLGWGGPQSS